MAEVRLVDLAVIKRYSLAVRQERAPAEEILEALEDSAAVVIAAAALVGWSWAIGTLIRMATSATTVTVIN